MVDHENENSSSTSSSTSPSSQSILTNLQLSSLPSSSSRDILLRKYSPRSFSSNSQTSQQFSHESSSSTSLPYQRKPWKKVLYERQPYPDNYIDPNKFLAELELNSTSSSSESLTFSGIFLNTAVIIQQITALVIFLTIHQLIQQNETMNILILFLINGLLLTGVYLVSILLHKNIIFSLKSLILFLICLRIIAPILQTLTSSYSDDTINALVLIFSTIHLVFHDYAYVNNIKDIFSGNVSLNAAMFTAVLLASRLHKIELVTAFISLAIISFSFLPTTLKLIKQYSLLFHIIITIIMWLIASILLYSLKRTPLLLVIYQLIIGFVWIICPLWLSLLSRTHKRKLKGPWDIAELPECDEYIPSTSDGMMMMTTNLSTRSSPKNIMNDE